MKAWVIFYTLKDLPPKKRTKIQSQLYGKTQQSNFGKYQYQVKGLVPENSYIRPVNAVLIVKKRYVKKVTKFLETNQVKYRFFEITIDRGEFEKTKFL